MAEEQRGSRGKSYGNHKSYGSGRPGNRGGKGFKPRGNGGKNPAFYRRIQYRPPSPSPQPEIRVMESVLPKSPYLLLITSFGKNPERYIFLHIKETLS